MIEFTNTLPLGGASYVSVRLALAPLASVAGRPLRVTAPVPLSYVQVASPLQLTPLNPGGSVIV
jgi:hypothetical protein